jgi:hypothetical protein
LDTSKLVQSVTNWVVKIWYQIWLKQFYESQSL